MSARDQAMDALVRKLDAELGEEGCLRERLDERLLAHGFPRLAALDADGSVRVYAVEPPAGEGDETWFSRGELRLFGVEGLTDLIDEHAEVRIERRIVPVETFLREVAGWES